MSSLEELKKTREQLIKDLTEMKYQERIVEAAVLNPVQAHFINELRSYNKPTKHSLELLKAQNIRNSEINTKINTSDLINNYEALTGVHVNDTLITIPVDEDSAHKHCYLYEVDAQIENLEFKIIYSSTKPPDDLLQSKVIIKQITFASTGLQEEAQEDLDFLSQHCTHISIAVLYLKKFYKLNKIRHKICKKIMNNQKDYINIGIIDSRTCIIFKGLRNSDGNFHLYWKIKLNHADYSVTDSFKVETALLDQQSIDEMGNVFKKLCNHSNWSSLSENDKLELLNSAVVSMIAADNRHAAEEGSSSVSVAEYSTS